MGRVQLPRLIHGMSAHVVLSAPGEQWAAQQESWMFRWFQTELAFLTIPWWAPGSDSLSTQLIFAGRNSIALIQPTDNRSNIYLFLLGQLWFTRRIPSTLSMECSWAAAGRRWGDGAVYSMGYWMPVLSTEGMMWFSVGKGCCLSTELHLELKCSELEPGWGLRLLILMGLRSERCAGNWTCSFAVWKSNDLRFLSSYAAQVISAQPLTILFCFIRNRCVQNGFSCWCSLNISSFIIHPTHSSWKRCSIAM